MISVTMPAISTSALVTFASCRNIDKPNELAKVFAWESAGVDVNEGCPLAIAANRGDLDLMEVLIILGANVYTAMENAEDVEALAQLTGAVHDLARSVLEHGEAKATVC